MTEPKRTYGLWIERLERQGTQYVICRVMSREDEPYLEGLVLEGFVTDYPPSSGEEPAFCGFTPAFRDVYSVHAHKAERMLKTLRKIERQIVRDEARDAGDVFMAFAKAIGARWTVLQATKGYGSSYRDSAWEWRSVAAGRDLLRLEIATARRLTAEKHGRAA